MRGLRVFQRKKMRGLRVFQEKKMRGLRVFQRKKVRGLRLFSRVKISDLPAYVPINFDPSLRVYISQIFKLHDVIFSIYYVDTPVFYPPLCNVT